MDLPAQNRDIVVVGASAGGLEAVSQVLAGLPADFPAAVFVAMHMAAGFSSKLPELLSRRSALKANYAVHGEKISLGRVYVAPPDNHLMLRPGYLQVVRGPKENGHRPSVDALFRTAATAYGSKVIGVVLTGYLDCGTAGLLSIKARAGLAIAQDPHEAKVPDMPESAIKHVSVDHVAPLREISQLLDGLVRVPATPQSRVLSGDLLELEGDEPGRPADFVCPICQGQMTETEFADFQLFRCHVGHAFSLQSVVAEQVESVERALWASTRALEEAARLSKHLAAGSAGETRQRFLEKARAQEQNVQVLRRILLNSNLLEQRDAQLAKSAGPPGAESGNGQGEDDEAALSGDP